MEMKCYIPKKTYQRRKNWLNDSISRSVEPPVEYENVCRLCLEKHDNMIDILKDDSIVPANMKIKALLGLQVEQEDELSTLICENCLTLLNEFYNFKKRCIANFVKLRQLCLKRPLQTWNEPNESLSLLEEKGDPTEQKKDCTITWDDRVPLVGIITTHYDSFISKQTNCVTQSPPANSTENTACTPKIRERNETLEHSTPSLSIEISSSNLKKKITEESSPEIIDTGLDNMPLGLRLLLEEVDNTVGNTVSWPKCNVCGKHFKNPSLLKRHMRVHTGEKPFICSVCEHAFPQKESLNRHILQLHSTDRPYECEYCHKNFAAIFLLRYHIKESHMKKTQYRCGLCPKVFNHASGLSRHKNRHNGSIYICRLCEKTFTDSSTVNRHAKLAHRFSPNVTFYKNKIVGIISDPLPKPLHSFAKATTLYWWTG